MPLEQIASASQQTGGQPPWFQLYWQESASALCVWRNEQLLLAIRSLFSLLMPRSNFASLTLPG